MSAHAGDHLGRGWGFPPRFGGPGGVVLVENEEDVREAILLLLRTGLRERVMHPEFGVGIQQYVFAERTAETCFRLESDIERALVRFEPRVIVDRVEATIPDEDEPRIDVLIEYRLDEHHRPASMVFPFYLDTGVRTP
jgi:phage baseplate assembly protein W